MLPGTTVGSYPAWPPLEAMSQILALYRQGSFITRGQAEVPGLGCALRSILSEDCAKVGPTPHLGIMRELVLELRG